MRICDRCFHIDGSSRGAVDQVVIAREDIRIDVCESCKQDTIDFFNEPKMFRKYTKKNKT